MKPSHRNIRNATQLAETHKGRKPKASKYALKMRPEPATVRDLADKYSKQPDKCGRCKQDILPITGACGCPYPGEEGQ